MSALPTVKGRVVFYTHLYTTALTSAADLEEIRTLQNQWRTLRQAQTLARRFRVTIDLRTEEGFHVGTIRSNGQYVRAG